MHRQREINDLIIKKNELLSRSNSDRVCKMQWAWVFGLYETVKIMSKDDTLIPNHYWWDIYSSISLCFKTKSRKSRKGELK